MNRRLRAQTRSLRPELVDLTQRLIRVPSYSLQEEDVARCVEDALKRLGYDLVFRDDAGNVVGVVVGDDYEPTVLLSSHMDTVTPGDESAWNEDPLSGSVHGRRVWGLGASDCKSGLAAQMLVSKALGNCQLSLRGSLVVAATVAEEAGCGVGVRHLLTQTLPEIDLRPTIAILGEPTGLRLCNGHEGWVEVDAGVEGMDPDRVRRASERIVQSLDSSQRWAVTRSQRAPRQVREPDIDLQRSRQATVTVSRRVPYGETVEDCVSWVRRNARDAVGQDPDLTLHVGVRQEHARFYTGTATDVLDQSPPWRTDPRDPLVTRARTSLRAAGWGSVRVRTWHPRHLCSGSSGSVMRSNRVTTLMFGPGDHTLAHLPNESVDLRNLSRALYGTASIVHGLIGRPYDF